MPSRPNSSLFAIHSSPAFYCGVGTATKISSNTVLSEEERKGWGCNPQIIISINQFFFETENRQLASNPMSPESTDDDRDEMQYRIDVELSERELISIGKIIAVWGSLEYEIFCQTLACLNDTSDRQL